MDLIKYITNADHDTQIQNLRLVKMEDEEYFAYPAVSAHSSYKMITDPLAWQQPPKPPTPQMKFGTAFHFLLLQCLDENGEFHFAKFEENYLKIEKPDLRTKAGREARDNALKEAEGREIIYDDDFEKALTMYKRIITSKRACDALALKGNTDDFEVETYHEVVVLWDFVDSHGKTIPCKAKMDSLTLNYGADYTVAIIGDLKTANSANPTDFAKAVINFGYAWQAAFYTLPFREQFQEVRFFAVPIETEAPHNFGVYDLEKFALTDDQSVEQMLQNYEKIRSHAEDLTEYVANDYNDLLDTPAWWSGTFVPVPRDKSVFD